MKSFTLVTRIPPELALAVVVRLIDSQVCLFSLTPSFMCINVRSSSLVMRTTEELSPRGFNLRPFRK